MSEAMLLETNAKERTRLALDGVATLLDDAVDKLARALDFGAGDRASADLQTAVVHAMRSVTDIGRMLGRHTVVRASNPTPPSLPPATSPVPTDAIAIMCQKVLIGLKMARVRRANGQLDTSSAISAEASVLRASVDRLCESIAALKVLSPSNPVFGAIRTAVADAAQSVNDNTKRLEQLISQLR